MCRCQVGEALSASRMQVACLAGHRISSEARARIKLLPSITILVQIKVVRWNGSALYPLNLHCNPSLCLLDEQMAVFELSCYLTGVSLGDSLTQTHMQPSAIGPKQDCHNPFSMAVKISQCFLRFTLMAFLR